MEITRPKVGVGVYITDGKGNLLMFFRKSPHEPGTWCPPGGHLEMGESFLDCCKKEVLEEVGLNLEEVEMLGVVNNVFSENKHYVNVDFLAKGVSGEAKIGEPDKCEKLGWYSIDNLPSPLMLPVVNLFKTYPEILKKLKTFNSFKE
jgi:8-oxo-dGTP diphosphatase